MLRNVDTRGMLTRMLTRRMQQNPGTRKVSGARKALMSAKSVPEKLRCQQSSGVSKILVPEKLWCQKSSGVSKVLVSAKSWYQKSIGTSKVLVSVKFWY
jgi:hypothetical protein